jgi:hypothetical protein
LIVLLGGGGGAAGACQCGTIPGPAAALSRAQLVIAAEVLYSHAAPARTAAQTVVVLRVDRIWKGPPAPTVTLLVGRSNCDYDQLERGGSYLLFADRLPGPAGYLTASRCLPSQPLRNAATALAVLGPGKAVPHTGGGGSASRLLLLIAAGLVSLMLGIYVFFLRTR